MRLRRERSGLKMNIIYEINTAVWLNEQAWAANSSAPIDAIPESQIEEWASQGIDMVWFLGVWRRGDASRQICLADKGLSDSLESAVPGALPEHVIGSPFSIFDYVLSPRWGTQQSLLRLRKRLHDHGIRLMLDFVPNHLAVDHAWVEHHPERLVRGTEVLLTREPGNYFRAPGHPDRILAHGRDPYFPGWTDTVQINIFSKAARQALIEILLQISDVCDAVRCDMAMLVANDVFRQTWGDLSLIDYPTASPPEFWEEAIATVKARHPQFLFAAEVYWDLEARLQSMGFDLTYDKGLYDRLRMGDASGVRKIFFESPVAQEKMIRFIENHDETRAAKALGERNFAAAVTLFGLPGHILFHYGQFEGRAQHTPVQLSMQRPESVNAAVYSFYARLLALQREHPAVRNGQWLPLAIYPGWENNETYHSIITYWRHLEGKHYLFAANIGSHQAQAFTNIPIDRLPEGILELRDLMGNAVYYRSTEELSARGLYLDMPSGGYHIFMVSPAPGGYEPDYYMD